MLTSCNIPAHKDRQLTANQVVNQTRQVTHAFFDVDGTLIDDDASKGSVWGRIHKLAGIGQETREERLALHRKGQISYDQWMSMDIHDWQRAGITKSQILAEMTGIRLSKGAENTVNELHRRGIKLGIISSSIDVGILSLLDEKLFEEIAINRLYFNAAGHITDWDTSACKLSEKGERLRAIAQRKQLAPENIAFIGNDFNDVGAANFAGVSFAFNCIDEQLQRVSSWVERGNDMSSLLRFFPSSSAGGV